MNTEKLSCFYDLYTKHVTYLHITQFVISHNWLNKKETELIKFQIPFFFYTVKSINNFSFRFQEMSIFSLHLLQYIMITYHCEGNPTIFALLKSCKKSSLILGVFPIFSIIFLYKPGVFLQALSRILAAVLLNVK